MKIQVVGSDRDFQEFEQKFGAQNELVHFSDYQFLSEPEDNALIFDFFIGTNRSYARTMQTWKRSHYS